MDEQKIISFSTSGENVEMTPEEIENFQFVKLHFKLYSADKVNAHNYICPLKVLKKYSSTIAGKPILAFYNRYANNGKGDVAGHEDSEIAREYPIGFFPNDAIVTYEKDADGVVFACADGYIWNVYYEHIIDLFRQNDNKKGVSSEMFVIDSKVREDIRAEEIIQFSFTGVTVLGDTDFMGNRIMPAIQGCNAEIVKNSVEQNDFEKAKMEFEKILYNSKNQESENSGSYFY